MNDTNGAHAVPALRSEVRMERTAPPPTPEPALGTHNPLDAVNPSRFWDWTAREAAWSLDVFVRMFATILVLRTVSQLVSHWWFPRTIWDASPSLVRGFGGTVPTPERGDSVDDRDADTVNPEDDEPEFVIASDGERFYRHRTRHPRQYWACPLLRCDPCRECTWFTADAAGQPRCAAVMKLVARHHAHYRHFSLEELRDLLEQGRPGVFA